METLIGRPRKATKHAAEELEKKADLAFLERMKKRNTPIGKGIPWQTVKKSWPIKSSFLKAPPKNSKSWTVKCSAASPF